MEVAPRAVAFPWFVCVCYPCPWDVNVVYFGYTLWKSKTLDLDMDFNEAVTTSFRKKGVCVGVGCEEVWIVDAQGNRAG